MSLKPIVSWCFAVAMIAVVMAVPPSSRADQSAFDLPGPRIDVRVSRAGKSMPISQVPNLQPGDRLWLHADLPKDQSAHYLLIATFLRGSTNPPPEDWFIKIETWRKPIQEEGFTVTVPQDAQQMLLFLAPETGGDFSSLRTGVRGKPGAFVRASQDLNRAGLDRSRLDAYLEAVQHTSDVDPKALQERSELLARSLAIKLDKECFDKPTEQQGPCLTQNTDQLVLDDAHSQSMVAALTSGASADLMGQISATPTFGGGFYSPYVGAILDVVRLFSGFHNPEYQYIPALAMPKDDHLELRLNNPPSFRKPKSVIVVGLPAVEPAQLPPLRLPDAKQVFCATKSSLTLPVEGAPLIFSTSLGHDFVLHVQSKNGNGLDLPAKADATRGGFVIDTHALKSGELDPELTGTLRGFWGYQSFDGPTYHLQSAYAADWKVASPDQGALVIGREDTFHLQAGAAWCVEDVTTQDATGKKIATTWKVSKPDEIEVQVALQDVAAGAVAVQVKQAGLTDVDKLTLHSFSEAAHLDSFVLHQGDPQGVLNGTRLDEVAGLDLNGIHFAPGNLTQAQGQGHGPDDSGGVRSGQRCSPPSG